MVDYEKELRHVPTRKWQATIEKYAKMTDYKMALDIGTGSGLSSHTIMRSGDGHVITLDVRERLGAMSLARDSGWEDRLTEDWGGSHAFFEKNQDTFQFICIDGSHEYEDVLIDARESWKILDKGGIIVFGDYGHAKLSKQVGKAVDEWAKEVGVELIVEHEEAIAIKYE